MKRLPDMENVFYTFEQIDKSIHEDLIPDIISEQKKPFEKPEFEDEEVD